MVSADQAALDHMILSELLIHVRGQVDLAEFALAKQSVAKLEDEVFSLRKPNAAYKRKAEELEWREAVQFDIICTDDWQSTGAGLVGKSSALCSVRRALAAACSLFSFFRPEFRIRPPHTPGRRSRTPG